MKKWFKLAPSAVLIAALSVHAQTADQRRSIQRSIEPTELESLADKFQKQYEADEAKVQQYLLDNPTLSANKALKARAVIWCELMRRERRFSV